MIKNIAEIIRKQGGKVLVNDVTTGIGRTGNWFGYNHCEEKRDPSEYETIIKKEMELDITTRLEKRP